jgi:hypothetical protein
MRVSAWICCKIFRTNSLNIKIGKTKELADRFVDCVWSSVRAEFIAIAFAMMKEGAGRAQG